MSTQAFYTAHKFIVSKLFSIVTRAVCVENAAYNSEVKDVLSKVLACFGTRLKALAYRMGEHNIKFHSFAGFHKGLLIFLQDGAERGDRAEG
jgi:hypothetical protein